MPAYNKPQSNPASAIRAQFEAKKARLAGEEPGKPANPGKPGRSVPPEARASKPPPDPIETFEQKRLRKLAAREGRDLPPLVKRENLVHEPEEPENEPEETPAPKAAPARESQPRGEMEALALILQNMLAELAGLRALVEANARTTQLLTSAVGNLVYGRKTNAANFINKIPGATPPAEEPKEPPAEG